LLLPRPFRGGNVGFRGILRVRRVFPSISELQPHARNELEIAECHRARDYRAQRLPRPAVFWNGAAPPALPQGL
jgi:hypothetical protein